MLFRHDADTDMLYIQLANGVSLESEEVAPGIVLDLDADEHVVVTMTSPPAFAALMISGSSARSSPMSARVGMDPGATNRGEAFEKVDAFNFPATMSRIVPGYLEPLPGAQNSTARFSRALRAERHLHAQNGDKITTGIWRLVFAW